MKKWKRTRPARVGLEIFMKDMLDIHKKVMVEDKAVSSAAVLHLLDSTANYHVIGLDHLEEKEL
jgi:hypothetical protein